MSNKCRGCTVCNPEKKKTDVKRVAYHATPTGTDMNYIYLHKNNSAITLIALVITIIVLLILAGITLAFVLGENGIIAKSRRAKEETEKVQAVEDIKLKIFEAHTIAKTEQRETTLNDLYNVLKRSSEEYEVTTTAPQTSKIKNENPQLLEGIIEKLYVKNVRYSYVFEIGNDLQILNELLNTAIPNSEESNSVNINMPSETKNLFNSANYNFNLKELLSNEEIMDLILENADARNYIIDNDEIFNLANQNEEIMDILQKNDSMMQLFNNNEKWSEIVKNDSLTSCITSITPSYTYSSYKADYAFDNKWNDSNKVWSATYGSSNKNQNVICEFNTPVCITQVKIKPGTINSEYVKGFSLYGSNDGTNFDNLIYTGEHGKNDNFETFKFNNSISYSYIKLQINSIHNSNASFNEIIYGGYIRDEAIPIVEIGDCYDIVNELERFINYTNSLENTLNNEYIMKKILASQNTRNYIISCDVIYNLIVQNTLLINNLKDNDDMVFLMFNSEKWNKFFENCDSLTSLIKNITASYTYSSYKVDYAFDNLWNDSNKAWSATYGSSNKNQNVICEFNNPVCITQVKIKPGTINSEYVKGFSLYGSNDGTNFDNLIYTGEHGNNSNFETFSFNNSNLYKYVKLQINSAHNSNVSFIEIIYGGYAIN